MIRLYKVYIRSIFEYGSICFLHCPESTLDVMQKIQNRAIRICLKLPKYVSLKILHESSCLATIKDRFFELNRKIISRMIASNPLIKEVVKEHESGMLQSIRQHGRVLARPHRSPLDIILPA